MADAKKLDDLDRYEIAILWHDCVQSRPDLFASQIRRTPPLLELSKLTRALDGRLRDDVGVSR